MIRPRRLRSCCLMRPRVPRSQAKRLTRITGAARLCGTRGAATRPIPMRTVRPERGCEVPPRPSRCALARVAAVAREANSGVAPPDRDDRNVDEGVVRQADQLTIAFVAKESSRCGGSDDCCWATAQASDAPGSNEAAHPLPQKAGVGVSDPALDGAHVQRRRLLPREAVAQTPPEAGALIRWWDNTCHRL
jgi:hypothetical protein